MNNLNGYLYFLKSSLGPHLLPRFSPAPPSASTQELIKQIHSLSELHHYLENLFPDFESPKGSFQSKILISIAHPNPHQKYFLQGPELQLFSKMIHAMKLNLDQIYLTTWNKTIHGNQELLNQIITREIELLQPKIILNFGLNPYFHGKSTSLQDFRNFQDFISSNTFFHCPLLSTHSVEHLLINANLKSETWIDLQKVMKCLEK